MLKKIFCILLVTLMVLTLAACEKKPEHSSRFILVSSEEGAHRMGLTYYKESVFYDKETGVMYLGVRSANQLAMTVLLNADGSPMLYEGK